MLWAVLGGTGLYWAVLGCQGGPGDPVDPVDLDDPGGKGGQGGHDDQPT